MLVKMLNFSCTKCTKDIPMSSAISDKPPGNFQLECCNTNMSITTITNVVGLTRDINRFSHVPVDPFWDASHAYHCLISSHDSGVGST